MKHLAGPLLQVGAQPFEAFIEAVTTGGAGSLLGFVARLVHLLWDRR
jgi:hypothetical protein